MDRPTFNEANVLEAVDVTLRGASSETPFVSNLASQLSASSARCECTLGPVDEPPMSLGEMRMALAARVAGSVPFLIILYTVARLTRRRRAASETVSICSGSSRGCGTGAVLDVRTDAVAANDWSARSCSACGVPSGCDDE